MKNFNKSKIILSLALISLFLLSFPFAASAKIYASLSDLRLGTEHPVEKQNLRIYLKLWLDSDDDYLGDVQFYWNNLPIKEPQIISIVNKSWDEVFVDFVPEFGGYQHLKAVVNAHKLVNGERALEEVFTIEKRNIFIDYDTDGDATSNKEDSDDDNDGLSDKEEAKLNTDPVKIDTDGDTLTDGKEVKNGTDPLVSDNKKEISLGGESGGAAPISTPEGSYGGGAAINEATENNNEVGNPEENTAENTNGNSRNDGSADEVKNLAINSLSDFKNVELSSPDNKGEKDLVKYSFPAANVIRLDATKLGKELAGGASIYRLIFADGRVYEFTLPIFEQLLDENQQLFAALIQAENLAGIKKSFGLEIPLKINGKYFSYSLIFTLIVGGIAFLYFRSQIHKKKKFIK